LLWKFGHLGKRRIPSHHEALISCIQGRWPDLLPGPAGGVFARLDAAVGGPSRCITISFLLHLLKPEEVPIIDQFNFRAMNYYCAAVRPGWGSRRRPSALSDLERLSRFLSAITHGWSIIDPSRVPLRRDPDRFLLMKSKSLKSQKALSTRPNRSDASMTSTAQGSHGRGGECGEGWIGLPYGGPGVMFHVSALVQHLRESGHPYIIQGQAQCAGAFSAHRKPQSLDFWLRRTFAKGPTSSRLSMT
jgi:hypothetical protein